MSPPEACGDVDKQEDLFSSLEMFQDHLNVKKILQEIPTIMIAEGLQAELGNRTFVAEKAFQDLKTILDKYQAQPHLMDPHLEELLSILLQFIMDFHSANVQALQDTTLSSNLQQNSQNSLQYSQNTNHHSQTSSLAMKKAIAGQAFKYIYLLTKVRGYKSILKKFPHEVSYLIPILQMLEQCQATDSDFYDIYVLLLWLSIVIYMPFNLKDFGAAVTAEDTNPVQKILSVIKLELRSSQSSRDMAAFLASKVLTRPDLRTSHLPAFVEDCLQVISDGSSCSFEVLGCLRSLGLIWKHGRREELLPLSSRCLKHILQSQITSRSDSLVRKLALKLVQRIGLTFLPPRMASWRYQRGQRSLAVNVITDPNNIQVVPDSKNTGSLNTYKSDGAVQAEDDDDVDVNPEMEDIIDVLLRGLKDTETIVRYSCSKGVGRVCARLPRALGTEVVSAVLACFSPTDSHHAWHGACLALAEMGRRGLLLPVTLPDVVRVLQQAFVYDKLMGQNSVGSNVRDAACYLCWSLARAYDPHTLAPYVEQLATGLLLVALFDREIPCRHAAAAAFQEHVGRQGSFPHGIAILVEVDYFSVGVRATAYLKLAPFVASFEEYRIALIDHLLDFKLSHWDTVVRQLAAKSLALLTEHCPEYCSSVALPRLLTAATGPVLVARHGAILALGGLVSALYNYAQRSGLPLSHFVNDEAVHSIWQISRQLQERRLLQGVGGVYMRAALSDLICGCCNSRLPLPCSTAREWLALLEEGIVYEEENVRTSSVKAIALLWSRLCEEREDASAVTYSSGVPVVKLDCTSDNSCNQRATIPNDPSGAPATPTTDTDDVQELRALLGEATMNKYLQRLSDERENWVQGWAAALGEVPRAMLLVDGAALLGGLMAASRVTPQTAPWATARKHAIASITAVVLRRGFTGAGAVSQSELDRVLRCLLDATDDYTTDRRGDVGAWVREAAVTATQELLLALAACPSCPVSASESQTAEALCRIVQLCVERIDCTRRVAGAALSALLHSCPPVQHIPHHTLISQELLGRKICGDINWGSDRVSFPLLHPLLALQPYSRRLIMGYAYSLGGVSATLAQSSKDALEGHLQTCSLESVKSFVLTLLQILTDKTVNSRLVLPVLKTLEHFIMSTSLLDEVLEKDSELAEDLVSCLRRQSQGCHDYHKLVSLCSGMAEMLRLNSTVSKPVLTQLLVFLGYQYPKVRAVTATSLLTALGEYGEDLIDRGVIPSQDALDEVLNVLEETLWMESDLLEVRKQRNKCCVLLDLPPPVPKKRN
ncbi:Tubulin-specific chaperone D C-terminal [Trinorchestia longiramus]|nr:Tubulin-specific chaperone D C-terminal [Trinorchestia longiramus]